MSVISNDGALIVCIAHSIDHHTEVKHLNSEITCSPETVKRINELGVQSIAFNRYAEKDQVFETLENQMLTKARLLKDRLLKKDQDFIDAINFLELFSLYALQSALSGTKQKNIHFKTQINNTDLAINSSISELIQNLEKLSKTEFKGSKTERNVTKKQVKRACLLIDKIFNKDLDQVSQLGLVKYVNKAEKIIKKFSS
jgi:hypothetical protein